MPITWHVEKTGRNYSLTQAQAREACEHWLTQASSASSVAQETLATPYHVLLRSILQARMGTTQRDILLSELLHVLWDEPHPLAFTPQAYTRILRAAHAKHLPRTRRSIHRHLCSAFASDTSQPSLSTIRMWRTLLRAHAQAHDWDLLDEALRTSAAAQATSLVDMYRYLLLRLQHAPHSRDSHTEVNAILVQMRRSGTKLDDATLARLLHALAAPVRYALASHASSAELAMIIAPVQRMLDAFFEWLCHHNPTSPSATKHTSLHIYQASIAELLELEMFLLSALHTSKAKDLHKLRKACAPFPRNASTERIRTKLALVAEALQGKEGRYDRVKISLDAMSGQFRDATTSLRAWMDRDASPAAVYAQRRALVTLFSQACRASRSRRLEPMLQTLALGSNPTLWEDRQGYVTGAPTLVRLWTRFIGAWVHGVAVRRGKRARMAAMHDPYGWPIMEQALPLLQVTASQIPGPWTPVWDHPERCRALVAAIRSSPPSDTTSQRVKHMETCLEAMRVPPRIHRWIQRAIDMPVTTTTPPTR